jgi:hypothetical protein
MAESAAEGSQPVFVLTTGVVRWGIEELLSRKVHTFFPAFLEIRRAAVMGGAGVESSTAAQPDWGNLERYFRVPGGPPRKPNFRPFWHGSKKEGQGWMNGNIAGSYAPSSIRKLPLKVVQVSSSGYDLRESSTQNALKHLLYGQTLPVLPLAAFYYRNFGFTTDGPALPPNGLIDIFKGDFGFRTDAEMAEFDLLFSADIPDRTDWFEPLNPPVATGDVDGEGR